MNVQTLDVEEQLEEQNKLPAQAPLQQGLERLSEFEMDRADLEGTLADIEAIGGSGVSEKVFRLIDELGSFEPSVTMIGQIKSGKTTLVNTMLGKPGLLPADVNPWTSVVTSLHANVKRPEGAPAARFRFFDANAWNDLVRNGGRVGELASRAGAENELDKLREQVTRMREKTQERLGRRFELLLGQEHSYEHLDEDLLERYICMGDEFDVDDEDGKNGQFADITQTAELYLDCPHLPIPMCFRDTPGLNDTFMMREQITIRAIRESKLCVAVLSAHQALNTADMALIRLITNVRSRQVVVFVNRIDELADPARQIPEIRASLVKTLAQLGDSRDLTIIFGSALWGEAVQKNAIADLPEDSFEAMRNFATMQMGSDEGLENDPAKVWTLSGIPELFAAISERIADHSGADFLSSIRKRAFNFLAALRASSAVVTLRTFSDDVQQKTPAEIDSLIGEIERDAHTRMQEELSKTFSQFQSRTDQARDRFLSRAVESLLSHLERYGEEGQWTYKPDGLRILMRSAHQVMRRNATSICEEVFESSAEQLTSAYGRIFGVEAQNFAVMAPSLPDIPPPVALASTIALDLKTSWWRNWLHQRRGYKASAAGFRDLISKELAPIVDELTVRQVEEIQTTAETSLKAFLAEQRGILADITEKAEISLDALHGLFGVTAQEEREELFDIIEAELISGEETGEDNEKR